MVPFTNLGMLSAAVNGRTKLPFVDGACVHENVRSPAVTSPPVTPSSYMSWKELPPIVLRLMTTFTPTGGLGGVVAETATVKRVGAPAVVGFGPTDPTATRPDGGDVAIV